MNRLQNAIVGKYPISRPVPGTFIENAGDFRQAARVNFKNFFALILAAVLWGCRQQQPSPETPAPAPLTNAEPTAAQPRLQTIKIFLGAETLDAELALDMKEWQTGLMFRTNIDYTTAMLFVFPQPHRAAFWMKNCPISISAAYIDSSGVIQEIH